jgi:MarR family transcriptional regulator, organic hydroperoxide resistance regulator
MDDFNVEDTLGYLVSKAHQFMKNYFADLLKKNGLDITIEQWAVLSIVGAVPGASQSDIARMTQTDKANVMRMMDLLERKAYITRQNDNQDRRIYRIHLTPAGEEMLKAVTPIAQEANRVSSARIDPQDFEILKKMLRQIRRNIENAM